MSTTVSTADGFEVTSTTESAESMLAVLDEPKEERRARVIQDKGKAVKPESEDVGDLSDAASTLGKKGGQAAAEKRAADAKAKAAEEKKAAKEAKGAEKGPDEDPEPEPEAAAAEGTDAEKSAAAEKKAARHLAEARIRELAQERKAAEERAERAERELAAERRQRQAPSQSQEQRQPASAERQAAPDDDPEPKLEDFTEIGDYTRAVAAHATRQTIKAHEREQSAQREVQERQQAIQGHVRTFTERLAGVSASDPGHAAKMAEFTGTVDKRLLELQPSFMVAAHEKQPIHQLADEIMVSSHPREVLQYLTANPEEFQRIASLRTLRDVSRAMAIVEHNAKDAVTSAPSTSREPSRAKPPVQALTGSPNAASAEPDPDSEDVDAHIRYYNGKKRAAR